MAYIYAYLDEEGVVRYIGKGNGDRSRVHLSKPKNRRFAKWLLSNTPTIVRLMEDLTEDAAFNAEKELIAQHGRIGYEPGGTLFNHSEGGKGGTKGAKLSDETRQRMREDRARRRGEAQSKQRAALTTLSWSNPNTRDKRVQGLSKAARRPSTLAKRMKPCTVDGDTVFDSRKHLISVLGQGKSGTSHPNFRYVDKVFQSLVLHQE